MVAMVDPKIGLLGFAHPSEKGPNKDVFLGELGSRYGWSELAASPQKITLVYDQRGTPGWTPETNASYMVTNDNPDIFVVSGSRYIRLLLDLGVAKPIIMAPATGDPQTTILTSYGNPANVTGMTMYRGDAFADGTTVVDRRAKQLHDRLPNEFDRISTIRNNHASVAQDTLQEFNDMHAKLKTFLPAGQEPPIWTWKVGWKNPSSNSDIEDMTENKFDNEPPGLRPHGVIVIGAFPAYWPHNRRELTRAVKISKDGSIGRVVAGLYPNRRFVQAGGLMSYGPILDMVFRRVAYFVDKAAQRMAPSKQWSSPGHNMADTAENPSADLWYELVINTTAVTYLGTAAPPMVINTGTVGGITPALITAPLVTMDVRH